MAQGDCLVARLELFAALLLSRGDIPSRRARGHLDTQGFTTLARRESARRVLKAWQQDGHYRGVQKYIYSLEGLQENEVTGFWEYKARGENKGIANKPMDSGVGAKKAPNE
jgi:hypothetical protein